MNFTLTAAVDTLIIAAYMVKSTHPECSIVLHLQKKENECKVKIETSAAASLQSSSNTTAILITRSCTVAGWSKPSMPYYKACYYEAFEEDEDMREEKNDFDTLKLIYSVGYGVSLAALLFCCFRKLLCMRNYIHLHLFVTFMLRSLAVFIKDSVLFADKSTGHCTVSTGFSWLLVEGLHLQTLLLFTFTQTMKVFWIYATIGWGTPSVTILIWVLLKIQLDDEGCWDNLESCLWWIIKFPILLSIFINLMIFLNISRIIVQNTKSTHVNQNETQLYRRLVRSTLLLIPLFGLHHVVFALFPEHVGVRPRLYFELVLGSFQGFVVALLYCFLNGEVQKEIQRTLRRWWPETKTNAINLPTQEYIN